MGMDNHDEDIDLNQFEDESPDNKDDNKPEDKGESAGEDDKNKSEDLENKDDDKEEDFDPFNPEDEDDKKDDKEEEDDLVDEDRKTIDERVNKQIAPIQSKLFKQQREGEVNSFLNSDEGQVIKELPGAADKIRRLSIHPAFKNMKIEAVAAAALGTRTIMKLGAKRERKLSKQSRDSKISGNVRRPSDNEDGALPNFDEMTDKEFEQYQFGVMTGGRK